MVVHRRLGDDSRRGLIRWGATDQYVNGVRNKNLPEGKRVVIRFGVCLNTRCDRLPDVNFQASDWRWTNT